MYLAQRLLDYQSFWKHSDFISLYGIDNFMDRNFTKHAAKHSKEPKRF